jgi:putative transcriptional regulator
VKNRLRVLRAERAWSQQELADALESRARASTRSRPAGTIPSLPLAFRIADVFGLPIEQIFLRD